jgi:hypothetical protein
MTNHEVKCPVNSVMLRRSWLLSAPLGVLVACSRTIFPKVRLQVRVAPDEIVELRELLIQFAVAEGFVVQDVGRDLPAIASRGTRKPFYLSLDRSDTIHIMVTDFLEENNFIIAISEQKRSTDFDRVATRLASSIRDRWPNVGPYTD